MTTEPQIRAAVLRMLRAWAGTPQKALAESIQVSLRTVEAAENGSRCSDATWETLLAHYRERGAVVALPIGGEPTAVIVLQQ